LDRIDVLAVRHGARRLPKHLRKLRRPHLRTCGGQVSDCKT